MSFLPRNALARTGIVAVVLAVATFLVPGRQAGAQTPAGLRFSVTPAGGPTASPVTVASIDPCPVPAGTTETVTIQELTLPILQPIPNTPIQTLPVHPDGSWLGQVGVFGAAGTVYLRATCRVPPSSLPTAIYTVVPYEVATIGSGYWLANNGGTPASLVFPTGTAEPFGDAWANPTLPMPLPLSAPIVAVAGLPGTGDGYWELGRDGGVFAFGDAGFYGSGLSAVGQGSTYTAIAPSPDGKGYLLLTRYGDVSAFGDAPHVAFVVHSCPANGCTPFAEPQWVGIAAVPNGRGYWLVSDEGDMEGFATPAATSTALPSESSFIFNPLRHYNSPAVGLALTPDGNGMWVATSDGGVFAYGDAGFYGSMGGSHLNAPVTGIAATADGKGYWLSAADGGIFAFGDAPFLGSGVSPAGQPPGVTFVGIASTPAPKITPSP